MKKFILFAFLFTVSAHLFAQTAPSTTQVQKDINKVLKFSNDN